MAAFLLSRSEESGRELARDSGIGLQMTRLGNRPHREQAPSYVRSV
jgi:hypothetical protein